MSDTKEHLTGDTGPGLSGSVLDAMRDALHDVANQTIEAVVTDVPGYRDSLDEQARETLAGAVELALRGFLSLAAQDPDPSEPLAPALEGAYALGRGEARAGRSMDALLTAYRVGARVSWRGLAGEAARAGLSPERLVAFAELVFAYIDQLSAASVAGHADELAVEGRVRQRNLERLAHGLVTGAGEDALVEAAQRAQWTPPTDLVAVVLPEPRVDEVLARIDPRTLQPAEDIPGLAQGTAVLLVPDPGPRFEDALARGLHGAPSVVGPRRRWVDAGASFARARQAWQLGLAERGAADSVDRAETGPTQRSPASQRERATAGHVPDFHGPGRIVRTDDVLLELVLEADPSALADLRARALAPMADVRPAQAERLIETLRSWLLHRGRRDDVAADLFVHPQTVRYRMGQVRELFGDRLDDPRQVLELTVALGTGPAQAG